MVKLLADIKQDGWEPKAVELPAVLVTKETIEGFLKEHPEAAQ
jgi:ribose transport system substrate-binding protein